MNSGNSSIAAKYCRTLSDGANFVFPRAGFKNRFWVGHEFQWLRKNSRFLLGRVGHEFHSCRNCRPSNGGFQPLGECCPAKRLFPQPVQPCRPEPIKTRVLASEGRAFRARNTFMKPALGVLFLVRAP